MNEYRAERILSLLYISSAVLSLTSLICLATIWQYWTFTLNRCIDIDCGCILHGINTFNTFMGGYVKICHFGVYALVPVILLGLCLGGYHGYRCCINKSLEAPRRIYNDVNVRGNLRNGETRATVVVVRSKRRTPYKQWVPATFLTVLICCLSLSHAIVVTDGYYNTCKEYRKRLIQLLTPAGREVEVIHERLGCGAIFDFMDYLQSDPSKLKYGNEAYTGLALGLTIASTWFNFFLWILALLLNIMMARKRLCCCKSSSSSVDT